jgi:tRNA(Arg) A34 adenosine deaminase TadA
MTEQDNMRRAIAAAREGIWTGQSPFGASIVLDGSVIACEHNRVWQDCDCTAHAEVVALRSACVRLGTIDLTGAVVYSTTEPCPMCFTACHWARISRIVFGTRIEDARAAGFNELDISNGELKRLGEINVEIVPDFMRQECLELFQLWKESDLPRAY